MRTKKMVWIAAAAAAAVSLSACGPTTTPPATEPIGGGGQVSAEILAECQEIFTVKRDPSAGPHVIVLVDRTGSVADAPLPAGLATDLTEASQQDGALSVIAVEGEGQPPRLVAKQVPLSSPGERDRPSVGRLAQVMAGCVEQTYLGQDLTPTGPGTDLHAGLAMVAELANQNSHVWVVSDMVATVGPYALTPDLMAMTGTEAGAAAAARAPLNLHGAQVTVSGVANTSTALVADQRTWMRDYTQSLCQGWQVQGCETVTLDPVNPARADQGLPADPVPFATVAVIRSATSCTFEVPASLTFAGDSATLTGGADQALADPVAVLAANPAARVSVVGHTASSASHTPQDLLDLSRARAQAVADYLAGQGIDSARISTQGVGDTQPKGEDIDPGTGRQIPAQAAIERRVDIVVTGAGSCQQ